MIAMTIATVIATIAIAVGKQSMCGVGGNIGPTNLNLKLKLFKEVFL